MCVPVPPRCSYTQRCPPPAPTAPCPLGAMGWRPHARLTLRTGLLAAGVFTLAVLLLIAYRARRLRQRPWPAPTVLPTARLVRVQPPASSARDQQSDPSCKRCPLLASNDAPRLCPTARPVRVQRCVPSASNAHPVCVQRHASPASNNAPRSQPTMCSARVQRRASPAPNGARHPRPAVPPSAFNGARCPRPTARAIRAQISRPMACRGCAPPRAWRVPLRPQAGLLGADGRLLRVVADFGLATDEDWCATRAGTAANMSPGGLPSAPRADRMLTRTTENHARARRAVRTRDGRMGAHRAAHQSALALAAALRVVRGQ
jgi:hypothetical protein